MKITKRIEIDMGHRIPNHKSKCRNLHGHRYAIEVSVDGELITKGSSEGMVIDFSDLKAIMISQIENPFDHGLMLWDEDVISDDTRKWKEKGMKIIYVPFIPTVENIAKHIFEMIKMALLDKGIKLMGVKVWETPTCSAQYEG